MKFRIELDLASLITLITTISVAGGIFWGILVGCYYLITGDFLTALFMPLIVVIYYVIQSVVLVLMAFPLYKWFCSKNKGQLLSGKVHIENETI